MPGPSKGVKVLALWCLQFVHQPEAEQTRLGGVWKETTVLAHFIIGVLLISREEDKAQQWCSDGKEKNAWLWVILAAHPCADGSPNQSMEAPTRGHEEPEILFSTLSSSAAWP